MTRSALVVTQKTHVTIDLHKKSEWVPQSSKKVPLESFIDNVESNIFQTAKVNIVTCDNVKPAKRTALQNLRSAEYIIIKPADKNSAVIGMDTSAYIREAERQLSVDRFNNKLDKDPTKQFSDTLTNQLNNIYDNGYIGEKLSNTKEPLYVNTKELSKYSQTCFKGQLYITNHFL